MTRLLDSGIHQAGLSFSKDLFSLPAQGQEYSYTMQFLSFSSGGVSVNLKHWVPMDLGTYLYVMDEKQESYEEGWNEGFRKERKAIIFCIKCVRQGLSDVDIAE